MQSETKRIWNVRQKFFLKNIKKASKIHCLTLKLYTGPPICITGAFKSGSRGGDLGPRPPTPLDPVVSIGSARSGRIDDRKQLDCLKFFYPATVLLVFDLPKNLGNISRTFRHVDHFK